MPDNEEGSLNFHYAEFVIEAGKIKEFAQAIGLVNPIYFNKEAALLQGFKNIPVPPTFATVIDFWNDHGFYQLFGFLKLHPENVLHGEQSFEYVETMYAGDRISAVVTIKEISHKYGKTFYFLETIYKNQLSETVMLNHATLIEVGL
ncbi:MaoC family dehydratase N-terminal domain-containing protein [Sporosarcina sp. E16_8]|uniref:FAS1-like dehydratase domain-containing protein n=1 Tax=Sporosarcina sp. E16_8 TaxID=2789295 RepID=UPI001A93226E|nr:MaoC family dehydratase N-terminal domain-containing protein [Sporosarcina sp. E16_8]MBO0589108.1 MaoC family dehydratase N-terminal domain-containing protein [Sporosarcina sp. E16_8]